MGRESQLRRMRRRLRAAGDNFALATSRTLRRVPLSYAGWLRKAGLKEEVVKEATDDTPAETRVVPSRAPKNGRITTTVVKRPAVIEG